MSKSEKVIFLDIDGVITSARTGWYDMDIYAINFLLWLCKECGAKIVISSTWRHNHGKEFWQTIFGEHLHEDFKTPDFARFHNHYNRGDEIQNWLSQNDNVDTYCILDDDRDMLPDQIPYFVHTNSMNGLQFEDYEKAKAIFSVDGYHQTDSNKGLFTHPNLFHATRTK
jgi:hypothetical protein